MNNYDISSTGVNLELLCFFDIDLSRYYFEENFKRIDNNTFLFIDHGNHSSDFDFNDLKNYNFTKNDLLNVLNDCFNVDELKDLTDYHFSKSLSKLSKEDLIYLVEYEVNDLCEYNHYLNHNFEVLTVRGYCQCDISEVVFTNEAIKGYNFDDRHKFLSMMQDHFTNLFYDSPLYCRLTIDNWDDFHLDEFQQDQYSYDKQEIIDHAQKNIKHEKLDVIIEFLKNNLPEQPEHK